jgi:hypothetical protein
MSGDGARGLPAELAVAAVRFAPATKRLDELVPFHEHGIGLPRFPAFDDHGGYSGVVYGLPDEHSTTAPRGDHLIVRYLATAAAVRKAPGRLETIGYSPVTPPNRDGHTRVRGFALLDPEEGRAVLVAPTGERAADADDTESNTEEA